ncbi:hypothetical protein [Mycobacterium sp. 236(2023)]|uniref:hypothetical protein n=1 Tax=Mycobacterium sp. 236(2023) TaxID=3038163 RepID=UPI0024157B3B|nr:hypothetical protein [Mycobacterium sp. 236(2023)]MDG4663671.1 hypothetical protein [Mycobacterium sp. 236(2023)]
MVFIDPVMMSAGEMAKLETLAREEQGAINSLLIAVGAVDDATADAVIAAGTDHGFVAPEAPGDLGDLMLPTAQRPPDQVPDPRSPIGLVHRSRFGRPTNSSRSARSPTRRMNTVKR